MQISTLLQNMMMDDDVFAHKPIIKCLMPECRRCNRALTQPRLLRCLMLHNTYTFKRKILGFRKGGTPAHLSITIKCHPSPDTYRTQSQVPYCKNDFYHQAQAITHGHVRMFLFILLQVYVRNAHKKTASKHNDVLRNPFKK